MSEATVFEEILSELEGLRDPDQLAALARVGILPPRAYGVPVPELAQIGDRLGTDHELALKLWSHPTGETRILASMVADPNALSSDEAEEWVAEIDYWELTDQCALNLFWQTPYAYEKIAAWIDSPEQYVKRSGVALIAALAINADEADDDKIVAILPMVETASSAGRPHLRQAALWALIEVANRGRECRVAALELAREMAPDEESNRGWVGRQALDQVEGAGPDA